MIDDFIPNKNPAPQNPQPPAPPMQSEPSLISRTPPPVLPYQRHLSMRARFGSIITTILLLVSAPIIALLLTNFVFQSYQVDGPSMESTLHDNDRLIVLKLGHTWARITGNPYIPKRGEIVIFVKRGLFEAGGNREKQLIKRVIGLPGDRVVVDKGVITVFNAERPEGFQPDKEMDYGKVITTTQGQIDVTISPGEVFVVGDNRNNSLDSRSFGPISVNEIVGKLSLRILPLSNAKNF